MRIKHMVYDLNSGENRSLRWFQTVANAYNIMRMCKHVQEGFENT